MAERPESKRRASERPPRDAGSVAGPQRAGETLAPGLWLVATPIGVLLGVRENLGAGPGCLMPSTSMKVPRATLW